jgi:hypothetical protein
MPQFKTTYNILTQVDADELFNINNLNYDSEILPPTKDWDYSRELKIEDIDIWEVLYESSGGIGVYAAWLPNAEFYMITTGWNADIYQTPSNKNIETYYGQGAQHQVYKKSKELNIPLAVYNTWVDEKDLWLYTNKKI